MDEILEALKAEVAQLRSDIDFVAFEIFGEKYNEEALLKAYENTSRLDLSPLEKRKGRLNPLIDSRNKILLAMAVESFNRAIEVPTTLELMRIVIEAKSRISAAFGAITSDISREEKSAIRASSAKKTKTAIETDEFKTVVFEFIENNKNLKSVELEQGIDNLINGERDYRTIQRWISEFRTLQN